MFNFFQDYKYGFKNSSISTFSLYYDLGFLIKSITMYEYNSHFPKNVIFKLTICVIMDNKIIDNYKNKNKQLLPFFFIFLLACVSFINNILKVSLILMKNIKTIIG